MKHSPRHFDDLSYKGEPLTMRQMLTVQLEIAAGMAGQRQWSERIANSGELLMLEYAEQLTILDAIDEGFIKPVEFKNTPDPEK